MQIFSYDRDRNANLRHSVPQLAIHRVPQPTALAERQQAATTVGDSMYWVKLEISSATLGSVKYGNIQIHVYPHAKNEQTTPNSAKPNRYLNAPLSITVAIAITTARPKNDGVPGHNRCHGNTTQIDSGRYVSRTRFDVLAKKYLKDFKCQTIDSSPTLCNDGESTRMTVQVRVQLLSVSRKKMLPPPFSQTY